MLRKVAFVSSSQPPMMTWDQSPQGTKVIEYPKAADRLRVMMKWRALVSFAVRQIISKSFSISEPFLWSVNSDIVSDEISFVH